MRTGEYRITRSDGTYGADRASDEHNGEVLRRGYALIAEARRTYGFSRRDKFTAQRSRFGVLISHVKCAAPLSPADEVAEARQELCEMKARMLPGGPR